MVRCSISGASVLVRTSSAKTSEREVKTKVLTLKFAQRRLYEITYQYRTKKEIPAPRY